MLVICSWLEEGKVNHKYQVGDYRMLNYNISKRRDVQLGEGKKHQTNHTNKKGLQ